MRPLSHNGGTASDREEQQRAEAAGAAPACEHVHVGEQCEHPVSNLGGGKENHNKTYIGPGKGKEGPEAPPGVSEMHCLL